MPDNSEFLETEEVVHNLLKELNNIQSAVEQIENTKKSAQTIQKSAKNIVRGTTELVDMGKTIFTTGNQILERVDKVKFKEQFDKVEKLGSESVKSNKTILNRIGNLEKRNSHLSIGIFSLLFLQVVTLLVFLFLK